MGPSWLAEALAIRNWSEFPYTHPSRCERRPKLLIYARKNSKASTCGLASILPACLRQMDMLSPVIPYLSPFSLEIYV